MRYLVQVFNESQAFCRTARKSDAQKAYDQFCREYPQALVRFTETKRGVIAERPATESITDNASRSNQ